MATPKWRRNSRRPWTREDEELLRREWSELSVRELRSRLGRTAVALRLRASRLGLRVSDRHQSLETTLGAALRTGYAVATIDSILRAHKVPFARSFYSEARSAKTHCPRLYDPERVDAAIAARLATETVTGAARSRGLCSVTLLGWLRRSGVITGTQRRFAHRIPSDVIDRVVEEHRKRTQRAA